MVDLSAHKIPVFAGINNVPREPTAQLAGNSSNLIDKHNNLTDALEAELNALPSPPNSTDEIAEGAVNLYFSNERVNDRVNTLIVEGAGIAKVYDDATNKLVLSTTEGITLLMGCFLFGSLPKLRGLETTHLEQPTFLLMEMFYKLKERLETLLDLVETLS